MFWTVRLEQQGAPFSDLVEPSLEVEQMRVRRQGGQLLGHLVREKLLVVVKRRNVDESQERQASTARVVLDGDFSVALLGINYVNQSPGHAFVAFYVCHDGD